MQRRPLSLGRRHQFPPHVGDRRGDIDDPAGESFAQVQAKPSVERGFRASVSLERYASAQLTQCDDADEESILVGLVQE